MSFTDKTPSGHSGSRISNSAIWVDLVGFSNGSKVTAKIEIQCFCTDPIHGSLWLEEIALGLALGRVRAQRESK